MTALTDDQFVIAPDLRGRFFAFGRFFLFLVLFCLILVAISVSSAFFFLVPSSLHAGPSHRFILVGDEVGMAIASVLATLAMCTIEKRPFGTYGLGGRSKIRFLVIGLVTGGASLALLLGFLRLLGMFRFGYFSNSWLLLLHYGLLYAALFCAVAVAEETMFRGYVLVSLSQSISFWPSTIILSWIFASVHSFNASENRWGLISAGVYGIIQAYSFRRTGSLWFAIGVHATWDFAQSFVFGVPDSGTVLPGAMLRGTVSGPAWITGGKVGPEGSILMLLIFSIQLLIIWRISRNKHAPVTHIEDELAVPV